MKNWKPRKWLTLTLTCYTIWHFSEKDLCPIWVIAVFTDLIPDAGTPSFTFAILFAGPHDLWMCAVETSGGGGGGHGGGKGGSRGVQGWLIKNTYKWVPRVVIHLVYTPHFQMTFLTFHIYIYFHIYIPYI